MNKTNFLDVFGKIDEEYVYQAMQPWSKKKKRQTMVLQVMKKAACFILVITLGFGVAFHGQIYAAAKDFAMSISRILGTSDESLAPYTEVIHKSQTRNGLAVALEEVILTENSFLASVKIDKQGGDYAVSTIRTPKINGKEMDCSSAIDHSGETQSDSSESVSEWLLNKNAIPSGTVDVELTVVLWSSQKDADLDMNEGTDKRGQAFTFTFSASKDELSEDTFSANPDKTIEADGKQIVIDTFSQNNVSSLIGVKWDKADIQNKEYYVKATDETGKEYLYQLVSTDDQLLFELEGDMPSMQSRWLKVQLYELPFSWFDTDTDQTEEEAMTPVGGAVQISLK